MNRAAIDIGSNSLLLTVVDDGGAILHDEARIVGLGKGLGDGGAIAPERLGAAEQVLRDYVIAAKRLGIEPWTIEAVATSAARRATNADAFFARIRRETGIRVRIVSGDEEAELAWVGSQRDLPVAGPRVIVDLGAGSTEVVVGDETGIRHRVSLEIGSIRLTEALLLAPDGTVPDRFAPSALDRLRERVDAVLAPVPFDPAPETAIGVAATVTTLCAVTRGESAHGVRLTRAELDRAARRLLAADAAERRGLAAVAPERADYLLAGAAILDRVLAAAALEELVVSHRGLRFGLLA